MRPTLPMRHIVRLALLGLPLLATTAVAQSNPQTAAIESPAPVVERARNSAATGGIAREQYLQHAQERAGQRAGAHFDQMDANHDGILDRAEIRAWRDQHPRRAAAQPPQPAPQ